MNGLYVAVKYDEYSQNKLEKMFSKVPNVVKKEDYHTTILYSRVFKNIEIPKAYHSIEVISHYEIWPNHDKSSNALVGLLGTEEKQGLFLNKLCGLHQKFMKDNPELTYDYPEFKPHLTISYDVPEDYLTSTNLLKSVVLITDKIYQSELKE